MIETIYLTIIAALPAITSIIGIIAAVIKLMGNNKSVITDLANKFNDLSVEIHNSKEMDEVKIQMRALMESNRKLQTRYDELLTELTKVQHKEE